VLLFLLWVLNHSVLPCSTSFLLILCPPRFQSLLFDIGLLRFYSFSFILIFSIRLLNPSSSQLVMLQCWRTGLAQFKHALSSCPLRAFQPFIHSLHYLNIFYRPQPLSTRFPSFNVYNSSEIDHSYSLMFKLASFYHTFVFFRSFQFLNSSHPTFPTPPSLSPTSHLHPITPFTTRHRPFFIIREIILYYIINFIFLFEPNP